MDGIEKITARIRADADAELVQLREQTEAQILEIQTQSKACLLYTSDAADE